MGGLILCKKKKGEYNSIGGGVGLVSALWLGHWCWCRIGECAATRTVVLV